MKKNNDLPTMWSKLITTRTFLAGALILVKTLAFAQVQTTVLAGVSLENVIPFYNDSGIGDIKIMPQVNVKKALEEHDATGRIAPLYGVKIPVSLTKEDGELTMRGSAAIWRMAIRSKYATSLNFQLSELYLPEGSELYIFNQVGTMYSGPVLKSNVYDGHYVTDLIEGEEVWLQIILPKDSFEIFNIKVDAVIHGFNYSEVSDRGFNNSGLCNIDVRCPGNSSFGNQRDAVCKIYSSEAELCSGSLINDACQDLKSYLLTANHCLDGNFSNWVFRFNYDSPNPTVPTCRGDEPTTWITYSGASLKAAWPDSDFGLLELNGSVIGRPTLALAGWNRTSSTPTNGTCIHHPSGDVKKISFSTGNINITGNGGGTGTDHFSVVIGAGTLEHGSSGSPLLDGSSQIVGQLHSGNPACPAPTTPFFFGRFFSSWTGGGTAATRLSDWLGGIGTSPMTINATRLPFINGSGPVCSSADKTYTLNNPVPGATVTWSVTPASLFVNATGTGTAAILRAANSSLKGLATLTFSMGGSSTCSTIFLTATIWVGKPGVTIVGDDYMCEGGLKGIADINYNGADDQMQGISNISWSFTGPLTNFTSSYDHAQYKPGSTSGVGVITSSLTGTCGTAQADMPYQVVSCVQGGGDTELKVSPNPISGITNIEVIGGNLSNTETYQIIVYNRFGEILLTKEIIGSKGEIDLGQAKPDIYFIEARADGLHFREKVLKIR